MPEETNDRTARLLVMHVFDKCADRTSLIHAVPSGASRMEFEVLDENHAVALIDPCDLEQAQ
jgi:hypothetical protein